MRREPNAFNFQVLNFTIDQLEFRGTTLAEFTSESTFCCEHLLNDYIKIRILDIKK